MSSLAVIIPNYNKEAYLKTCVDSIMRQTVLPDEIIIVDDVSTDSSREIILLLAKENSRIKPVFLEKNGGVSNARNTGVTYANSDYVTFLDSDDFYFDAHKIQNELAVLADSSKKALAYSYTVKVNQKDELIRAKLEDWRYHSGQVDKKLIANFKGFSTIPRDYTMRKSVFIESGGYNVNRSLYEDFELSMKLACSGVEFIYTGQAGTAYRSVENGLSAQKKETLRREFMNIRFEYWKKYPSLSGKLTIIYLWICQGIHRSLTFIAKKMGSGFDK